MFIQSTYDYVGGGDGRITRYVNFGETPFNRLTQSDLARYNRIKNEVLYSITKNETKRPFITYDNMPFELAKEFRGNLLTLIYEKGGLKDFTNLCENYARKVHAYEKDLCTFRDLVVSDLNNNHTLISQVPSVTFVKISLGLTETKKNLIITDSDTLKSLFDYLKERGFDDRSDLIYHQTKQRTLCWKQGQVLGAPTKEQVIADLRGSYGYHYIPPENVPEWVKYRKTYVLSGLCVGFSLLLMAKYL